MRIALAILLLLTLVALPAVAGDLLITTEKIEVNGLVGSIGVAGGAFWPVVSIADSGVQLGPMVAIGESTGVLGGGAKIGVTIDAPILENLNFGWIGYGYNWVENDWGLEFGVGVTR